MEIPISRKELQNLRQTLEEQKEIQQMSSAIISRVIQMAESGISRQYSWRKDNLTQSFMSGLISKLRIKFPDSSVYFIQDPHHPTLIVDWS